MKFQTLSKLQPGDAVGIVSPSFVAPAVFPMEYDLGLSRLRDQFGLKPIELPHAKDPNATHADKIQDLVEAFTNPSIKAVITTLGGDHQIEYIHKLPAEPFRENPKPFFGYSDNTHFANFLFMHGVPSFYGGCVYTEYARQGSMDTFTERYLRAALFSGGAIRIEASPDYNDEDIPWGVADNLGKRRRYQPNEGWYWNGSHDGYGYTWGGCVEAIDEILRHGRPLPTLSAFVEIILFLETSEEIPSSNYVRRVLRALGERGILSRVQGVLVGRPKAWSFEQPHTDDEKIAYAASQRKMIEEVTRRYNPTAPIIQNLDFGHTAPSLCLPYGAQARILSNERAIEIHY